MTAIREGNLEYHFEPTWMASKYDQWPYYLDHFARGFGGNKAVDVVAHDPSSDTLWLIELKDYRDHPRTKTIGLAEEVALKVRDSLAGLFAAAKVASDHRHLEDAKKHLLAQKIRVVLHLELPPRRSKLFPGNLDLSKVQQQLKRLVRSVDKKPAVVNVASFERLPWAAASARLAP